jgi:F420-non-reducing hydrogenase large subunit
LNKKNEITLSPTTRIEGHGKVTIILDNEGNISDAYFHATEIRGFEYFLRGMEAENLPFIISRICGICSTAHVIASVKTIENIYKTKITETAKKLRELLLMGETISNHSLAFFFLTLPDFWFSTNEDPSKKNIFQIIQMNPEIRRKAIKLRTFGTHLMRLIGRREVHIVSVVPGGLIRSLKNREKEILLKESEEAYQITLEAVELGKELFEKHWSEFKSLGKIKTCYMGLVNDDDLEYYEGKIRLIGCEGSVEAEFNEQNYMDYIEEKSFPWTYAKFAYFKNQNWPRGIIQVGPTARINVAKRISTPIANEELKEFKRRFGDPAHEPLLFDYSRLIDLLYACERAKQLLEEDEITKTDTRVPIKPEADEGVGLIEAPRGTLAHKYTLTKNGKLKDMKLIIPTQLNNAAMNIIVKDVASKYIKEGKIQSGLLNSVEMLIRAYDPCIKCATRSLNEKMKIEIKNEKGQMLKII